MLAAPSENVLGSPRFEPIRILGEGGSGIVYEVRLRSGIGGAAADGAQEPPTLALKVLRAELAPSERERRRFLEEAERMQRLDAPGLVKLLEAGLLPDGRPYLAMPLLDGETLSARLRRGPLPAPVAVRYFEVLARAVQALHEAGMVHRDVKPENILVVDDSPVLLDFGIARDIDDDMTTTTAEGRVRGTPAYMAPERFFGAPASVRSDVYELGVVLYTMLVGRLPWGSEKNVTERLNPASPRDAGADVSSSLATVILRALSTRPEMRPASAVDLARDVAAAAADVTSSSRRTLDVEIQTPRPAALSDLATAPAAPVSAPTTARAIAIVAAICVIAAAAALGARAMRAETAQSPEATAVAAIAATPRVSPVAPVSSVAPVAPVASAVASVASAASSSPAPSSVVGAAPLALPVSAKLPARQRPTPTPSPSASGPDPARYFEDRR